MQRPTTAATTGIFTRNTLAAPVLLILEAASCASTQAVATSEGESSTEAADDDRSDQQLDGDDYLVQVAMGEYRAGKLKRRGPVRGVAPFVLANGEEVKSAGYHSTAIAKDADLAEGVMACFYRDKEKDGVFQKPASKEEARSGLWACRAVRDMSEKPQGHILVGKDKVALDNLRVEPKLSSTGL